MNADEDIFYFNENSIDVIFSCNEMGILIIDLHKIYLDRNFDEDNTDPIIRIRLLACHLKFEHTALKKR